METSNISVFAGFALQVICRQEWVRERCLQDPQILCSPEHLLDPAISPNQVFTSSVTIIYSDNHDIVLTMFCVFLLLFNPLENRPLKHVSLFSSLGHVMILERTFSLNFVIFTYTWTHHLQKIEVKFLWDLHWENKRDKPKRVIYLRTTNWNVAQTMRCLKSFTNITCLFVQVLSLFMLLITFSQARKLLHLICYPAGVPSSIGGLIANSNDMETMHEAASRILQVSGFFEW